MMMALRPDLVRSDRLAEAFGGSGSGNARSVLSPPIHRWRSFQEISPSGVIGDARRSSAAKGERLTEAAAEGLAAKLASGAPWA